MVVYIIGVGVFREIMNTGKISIEIQANNKKKASDNQVTVYDVLRKLDEMYKGKFAKELYLEDGSRNPWNRIMLNGWDIQFLDEDKLYINDNDTIMISSALAGG